MLHVKIITPRKLVKEMDAISVTLPTTEGEITILHAHADLLTLLKEGILTIKTEKSEEYLSVGGGFMETDGKNLTILVSRAFGQDEINEEMTNKALENAKNILEKNEEKTERDEALSTIRRSTIDMKLLSKIKRRRKV